MEPVRLNQGQAVKNANIEKVLQASVILPIKSDQYPTEFLNR
jgi:hypothetical protein